MNKEKNLTWFDAEKLGLEELFAAVAKALVRQKKKCSLSVMGAIMLRYREEDLASPVGFCIKPEDYKTEFEWLSPQAIPCLADIGEKKLALLTKLEYLHESIPISRWKTELIELAKDSKLANPFEEKHELQEAN